MAEEGDQVKTMTREELADIIEDLMDSELSSCSLGSLELADGVSIVPWEYINRKVTYMAVNRSEDPLFHENNLSLLQCLDLAKEQGLLK